ncbi:MAG TPA: flagellar motor protein MotB [Bryocella sp.]|nr:flagellar motor protein MotB [Bryocella sp.]
MRRQRSGPHVSHERWLVSYADFVTLLFAFFVVLYASAQVDRQKAVQLSQAIFSAFQHVDPDQHNRGLPADSIARAAQVGGNPGVAGLADDGAARQTARRQQALEAIGAELGRALSAEIAQKKVSVRMGPDGLIVSLREMGFYDSGSATIKPGAEDAFRRLANILQEHPQQVRIEGHSDNVPIHTPQFSSNWELSTARATGVVRRLIEDYGIAGNRLSAAGYAEFHPVASNSDPKGRQLNRRVDVVILR